MAAVPITFRGVFYPDGRTGKPEDQPKRGTFVGYAWQTGLGVGGGPMPGGPGDAHPEHPIELPPPVDPPVDPPPEQHPVEEMITLVAKPPPAQGGWGWFPEYGWMYFPAGGAQPKRPGR